MSGYELGGFGRNSHIPAVRDALLEQDYNPELKLTAYESASNVEPAKLRYVKTLVTPI